MTPSHASTAPHARHAARPRGDGTTAFSVWAPRAEHVDLELEARTVALEPLGAGWFRATATAAHGDRYAYRLDGGPPRPDPAARWLPDGVHEPAAVLDPRRLQVSGQRFQAAPVTGAVIYELHVGTFTPEGTFESAAAQLDALADLGVTHVEVMPVNAFDGRHGWGYDGVAWWAVHQPYGGPEAFAAFVDACHRRGLAVVLDVVYNHLGPSGNYSGEFGPYLVDRARSAWGELVNLDGPDSGPVRAFVLGSAVAWLHDFRVDALRLDAVHALVDSSATHILAELAAAVADLGEQTGRHLELIAESDRNDPQTIRPRAVGGLGLDAQWADDLHHAIHTAVTGERDGYYADYGGLPDVATAYASGFVHAGDRPSPHRRRVVGAPLPADTSSRRLVVCIQNHDQVGNRAAGERLVGLADEDLVRVAVLLLCAAPHTPLLFMGEEYGEARPFQFFADHPGEELRAAIRRGRREEFASFASFGGDVPDPLDPSTFEASQLDRSVAGTRRGLARRRLWQDALALRRSEPALGTGRRDLVVVLAADPERLVLDRRDPDGQADVRLVANLSERPLEAPGDGWTPLLSTADPAYGGPGGSAVPPRSAALFRGGPW